MKVENRERLIKAIGKLDGIVYCATGGVDDAICDVIEVLEGILDDEKKGACDRENN